MEKFRGNPETMKPTKASEHPRVIEANQIIGREAFKVIWEAGASGDVELAITAQKFLNGPDYSDPRRRKPRWGTT